VLASVGKFQLVENLDILLALFLTAQVQYKSRYLLHANVDQLWLPPSAPSQHYSSGFYT